jgi:hypothetical protein
MWSDNNPVVDDYIVTYGNKNLNSTTKSLTVTGLGPFTSYNFTVQARNSAKEGGALSSVGSGSFVVVKTGASEPSSPRNIDVAVVNATALNVTWLPPEFSNGILQNYKVKYERTDGRPVASSPDVVGNMTLSHVIVYLQEYTNYSISVQAVVVGNLSGAFSSPVIALTNASG